MDLALGALMLLGANVICVNLAGVLTFYLQGIRPRAWWEADRAKRGMRIAVILWTVALIVLMIVIYSSKAHSEKQIKDEAKPQPKTSLTPPPALSLTHISTDTEAEVKTTRN